MAKSISEEELQLRKRARRRLIGAIALATIVAVFLPMVLDHEPRPVSQDISIQIPSPNAGAFTSKIVPVTPGTPAEKAPVKVQSDAPPAAAPREASVAVAVPPGAKPAAPAATAPVDHTEAAPPKKPAAEPSKPQPKAAESVARSAPAPEKPQAAEPVKAEAKDAGTFVVQVAALNDAAKARQLQQQITEAGVKSYTEVVPTQSGNVTRVRAGPFGSRAEAEKSRDKLKEMGLIGNIVPK